MVQTVSAQDINLRYLIDHFQFERVQNQVEFFPEWRSQPRRTQPNRKTTAETKKPGFFYGFLKLASVYC